MLPLQGHEPVCGDHQRAVMMKAEVAAAFAVVESKLALELAILEFRSSTINCASRASRSGVVPAGRLASQ